MFGMRIALIVLGGLLGIALLARGFVVIGGLVLAMAVVRGVMVGRMHSMRGERIERRRAAMEAMRARRGI